MIFKKFKMFYVNPLTYIIMTSIINLAKRILSDDIDHRRKQEDFVFVYHQSIIFPLI